MKEIIYITKSKIWFDGRVSEYTEKSLLDEFKKIKTQIKGWEVRIVLGNDVSYICAFPQPQSTYVTREQIMEKVQDFLPIDIDMENFDWKYVSVGKENWIQAAAVERKFLETISKAVKSSKLKVNLMIPIGILMGQRSVWKEEPSIVKWSGYEKLSVLGYRGLADAVFEGVGDKEISEFAKQKWNRETDLNILTLDKENFDMAAETFSEKDRGADAQVLNIQIFKNLETENPVNATAEILDDKKESRVIKKKSALIYLLPILFLSVLLMLWVFNKNKKSSVPVNVQPVVTPTATPSATPTPTPTPTPDMSIYKVQVLNASGIAGLAGQIKDTLLQNNFKTVDTGNKSVVKGMLLQKKPGIPQDVMDKIKEILSKYTLTISKDLPESSKYDVVVTIGK